MTSFAELNLERLTIAMLKDELRAQDQKMTGNKSELIARLKSLTMKPITSHILSLMPPDGRLALSSPPVVEEKVPVASPGPVSSEVKISTGEKCITLSRDDIMHWFPQSLLSVALEQDKSADTIDITHPHITYPILDTLYNIIKSNTLPTTYQPADYITASRYLLIDLLAVLGDPCYPAFRSAYPEINILDKYLISERHVYESILIFSAKSKGNHLAHYVLNLIPKETYPDIDRKCFMLACYYGASEMVKYLLERGVDPTTTKLDRQWIHDYGEVITSIMKNELNQAIYIAVLRGHASIVSVLLQDKRVSWETSSTTERSRETTERSRETGNPNSFIFKDGVQCYLLDMISISGALDVAYVILNDERFSYDGASAYITDIWNPELGRIILSHPKVNPTCNKHKILDSFLTYTDSDMVNRILTDSRVDPNMALNDVCERSAINITRELVEIIVKNSRMDLDKLPDGFLLGLIKHDDKELLSKVVGLQPGLEDRVKVLKEKM